MTYRRLCELQLSVQKILFLCITFGGLFTFTRHINPRLEANCLGTYQSRRGSNHHLTHVEFYFPWWPLWIPHSFTLCDWLPIHRSRLFFARTTSTIKPNQHLSLFVSDFLKMQIGFVRSLQACPPSQLRPTCAPLPAPPHSPARSL